MMEALKGIGPGLPGENTISLLGPTHAQNRTSSEQILSTEKAIKLLEERGQITALTEKDLGAYITPEEQALLPEVRANFQDLRAIGIRHNGQANIPEPTEKGTHHENRRQRDEGIMDEDEVEGLPLA